MSLERADISSPQHSTHTHMHTHTYTCTHAYTHTHIHMRTHTHTYTHIHIHTHTCTCTHAILTNFTVNLLYYFRIASDILWGHIHNPVLIPSRRDDNTFLVEGDKRGHTYTYTHTNTHTYTHTRMHTRITRTHV